MLTSQGTRVERLFYIRVSTAVVLPKTTESLSKMYVFCNKEKCWPKQLMPNGNMQCHILKQNMI